MTPREKAYGEGFGTHIPLLASVIAKARSGGVWEIGVGHCSSPLIAEMCHASRRAYSVWDSDHEWLKSVRDLYPTVGHPVNLAVAFVDCDGPERLRWVRQLRDDAEFIVVHDTDNQGGDLAELLAYLDTFTYRYDYKIMRPWTTVVSMTRSYP